jgi:hypothetical protein
MRFIETIWNRELRLDLDDHQVRIQFLGTVQNQTYWSWGIFEPGEGPIPYCRDWVINQRELNNRLELINKDLIDPEDRRELEEFLEWTKKRNL